MRTAVLISRIARIVETGGTSGDGAALAEDYAAAVGRANARLEAVVSAADAKSISDAIRLMSEDPPLLEEASALDFFQRQDWENLCDMNGWTVPPRLDSRLVERVVEIGEAKDAIGPFLAMYKKAVRVNNARQAVKALRRLVDLDRSQDWSRQLGQSEKQLQSLIVEEFQAARKSGSEEACDRLAQELLDGVWKDGISVRGADEVRAYRERREATRRDDEGREDVAILKRCLDVKWDCKLALSLLRAVDGLVEKGWKVPDDGRETIEACRVRCAKEFEQEEAEKRWREVNETLHAAIQKEDCAAIRDALSVPEFLDRDPMDGMLGQAQAILDHEEAARRRKTLQIAAASLLSVLAVLGVSGWWLRQKLFLGRCADEAAGLAAFEKMAKRRPYAAIEGMSACLSRLEASDPEVFVSAQVSPFVARLKAIVAENDARTNRLELVLRELEKMSAASWPTGVDAASATGGIARAEAMLTEDDGARRTRLMVVKDSWLEASEKREAALRDLAQKAYDALVPRLEAASARLNGEVARDALWREVEGCRAAVEEWKTVHSPYAEEMSALLTAAEKGLSDAVASQCAYTNALEAIASARGAEAVLSARRRLVESFDGYAEVKALKPLSVDVGDVKDALASPPAAVKDYVAKLKGGITTEAFAAFLKESVLVIADAPEYYSLYGLVGKGDKSGGIVAVSCGKPTVDKPSYETKWKVTCESGALLSFGKKGTTETMKSSDRPDLVQMPSSDEMKTIVDVAKRSGLTATKFEEEVLKLIAKHIEKGHSRGYVDDEGKRVASGRPLRGWMSAYRRVQFLAWYMRWLDEDLKTMPDDDVLRRSYTRLANLADSVTVDGVDESLSWICLWDSRVRQRTMECAKLLSQIPVDWVARYRAACSARRAVAAVGDWQVSFAGMVAFDPRHPAFEKEPDAVRVSLVRGVKADHPLYALRKAGGKVVLVRAFEPGRTSTWRKCAEMGRTEEGYVLGEPLYHVSAGGAFIDVQAELKAIAKRAAGGGAEGLVKGIPIFSNGGN